MTKSEKAILSALLILSAAGIVIGGLGLSGQLPLYGTGIGVAESLLSVAGAVFYLKALKKRKSRSVCSNNPFPKDVLIHHIFSNLPSKDLASGMRVCDTWKKYARDDSLWKVHFEKEFPTYPLPQKNVWKAFQAYHSPHS